MEMIYSNYDLWNVYEDEAKENLKENGIENPTENEIWDEIYMLDEINWEDEKEQLDQFFDGSLWIMQGTVGRWNGDFAAGCVFNDFMDTFYKMTKDCDSIAIYEEKGHFFVKCSHHDGTNMYEIKKITSKGEEYLDRWENNWNDTRTERYIHNMLMKRYSVIPRYIKTQYV